MDSRKFTKTPAGASRKPLTTATKSAEFAELSSEQVEDIVAKPAT